MVIHYITPYQQVNLVPLLQFQDLAIPLLLTRSCPSLYYLYLQILLYLHCLYPSFIPTIPSIIMHTYAPKYFILKFLKYPILEHLQWVPICQSIQQLLFKCQILRQKAFIIGWSVHHYDLNLYSWQYNINIQRTVMSSRKKAISIKSDRFQKYSNFTQNRLPSEFSKPLLNHNIEWKKQTLQEINTNVHNVNVSIDSKFTSRLILIKKLQKLQKQAISNFYEGNHIISFQLLQKCLQLLKNEQIVDHRVYVHYLQTQFSYKNKNYKDTRSYYDKTNKIICKLNTSQRQKVKDYIICLQSLYTSLLIEEEKFGQALKAVDILNTKLDFNSSEKIIKQNKYNKIYALYGLKQYNKTLILIQQFIAQYQNTKDKVKLINMLVLCLKETQQLQRAQTAILDTIQECKHLQDKSYTNKLYLLYLNTFSDDAIKSIYICRTWMQETSNHSDVPKAKLFHLYYQIGDFQQSISIMDQLTNNNNSNNKYRKTAQDLQVQAQIKQFNGYNEQAYQLLTQALQLAKSEEKKIRLSIRLLAFEQNKEKQKQVQKKIKHNRFEVWAKSVFDVYRQYLIRKGDQERVQKLERILDLDNCAQLRQTGKFAISGSQQKDFQRRRYSVRF